MRRFQRVLTSSAHLIELDVLRTGLRVPMQQALPDVPYIVLLSRVEQRPVVDVWPIALDAPLPSIPIPLLLGDGEVPLDLQATFTATYNLLGYDLLLDYAQPPDVPLPPALASWAAQRVAQQGNQAGYSALPGAE